MPRAKTYTTKNFLTLINNLEMFEERINKRLQFLNDYGLVYKMPKKRLNTNISNYKRILAAINEIKTKDFKNL